MKKNNKTKTQNDIAISLTNVSKKYEIHHEKPTLVEKFVKSAGGQRNETFWALKDVNLTIKKGEKVGIIGPNGSGKTTLLKIITGITTPTTGRVEVNGRIASLIDLDAGFHPDLTGYQNIYLNGMFLGMKRKDIDKIIFKIIGFADIKQFIDVPLFSYSQGMKFRLGFAIAIYAHADLILIDEGIAVGDKYFIKKVISKINDLFTQGKTIIMVTQNFEFLEKYCTRIKSMQGGKITDVFE
ncbi:ABC transporter ATP-binding protein [Candidatus Gottesmanbacteria bacterium]|nr:ABC transporter ATP-binding protein [Candidatus Gottesmanbacteria bacterium]